MTNPPLFETDFGESYSLERLALVNAVGAISSLSGRVKHVSQVPLLYARVYLLLLFQ